jgi:hypothetical protein
VKKRREDDAERCDRVAISDRHEHECR